MSFLQRISGLKDAFADQRVLLRASTLLHQGKRTIPGIEYTNSTIDAIYHAEGRAVPDASTWDHEYVITDHLGNTRVRFHDDNGNGTISSGELLSTHDYYPFGMEWNAGSYPYTYNGKEQNGELGLDWLEERGMTARQVEYRELTDFFSVEKRKDGEAGQADPSGGSPLLRELRHRQEPGCRPGRKPDKINPVIYERLFFSENGSDNIKNSLLHLFRAVKRVYPKITSAKAIRSAVIAEWLKTKDIRIVQYMADHRWVSSTERYNDFNLQELKESLRRHHPLRGRSSSADEV